MGKAGRKRSDALDGTKHISAEIAKKVGTPACIIFIIIAVLLSIIVRQQVLQSKQTELTLESESAANELNTFFQEYLRAVEQLSVNPDIRTLMEHTGAGDDILKSTDYQSVFEHLLSVQQSDSENVMAIWIGDTDANVLTQSDGFTSGADFDITGREWFESTKTGSSMLTKPYTDASTGNVIVSAAAPVLDEGGNAIGVVGLDLSLDHVREILSNCTIGKSGYVILTASDGTIIYHPDDALVQKNLLELDISENVKNALTNQEDQFLEYKIDGAPKYGYVKAIEGTGYTVISNLTVGEYFQNIKIISIVVTGIFIIGIITIFMFIKKVSVSITKPIESLNDTAQLLADGNLDVELEITSEDEIGQLGHSIQKTIARLKTYIVYINEIAAILAQIADGKLQVELQNDYV